MYERESVRSQLPQKDEFLIKVSWGRLRAYPLRKDSRVGIFHPPSGGAKLTTVEFAEIYHSADSPVVQTTAPLVFATDGVFKIPNALKAGTKTSFQRIKHALIQKPRKACPVGRATYSSIYNHPYFKTAWPGVRSARSLRWSERGIVV